MSVDIAVVHPTRLELLRLRRRKALAQAIVDILKKDYDALILALFEFVREIPPLRSQIQQNLVEAYNSFVEAQMIVGSKKIEEVSLVCEPLDFDVKLGAGKKVLGFVLPVMEFAESSTAVSGPRFSILDTPAKLDESAQKTLVALHAVVKFAEAEASMREILDVMSVKRRQINRIEYKVLPQLDAAVRYVELILEESERQDAVRVRVLQKKRKERAQEAMEEPV